MDNNSYNEIENDVSVTKYLKIMILIKPSSRTLPNDKLYSNED
jgi:hypothetical protein